MNLSNGLPMEMPVKGQEAYNSHFVQSLRRFGDVSVYPMGKAGFHREDLFLERMVRLQGLAPMTCVVRTSRYMEDYLAETTAMNRKTSSTALFDQFVLDYVQGVARQTFGPSRAAAQDFSIHPSDPTFWPARPADAVCHFLVGAWPVDVFFWFNNLRQVA